MDVWSYKTTLELKRIEKNENTIINVNLHFITFNFINYITLQIDYCVTFFIETKPNKYAYFNKLGQNTRLLFCE